MVVNMFVLCHLCVSFYESPVQIYRLLKKLAFWGFFNYWVERVPYTFWIHILYQTCFVNMFSLSVACFSSFLAVFQQKFSILVKSKDQTFHSWIVPFVTHLRNLCLTEGYWDLLFSSSGFIISALTGRSMTYDERLLHMVDANSFFRCWFGRWVHLLQHHLLNCFSTFVENQLTVYVWVCFWTLYILGNSWQLSGFWLSQCFGYRFL